jgi:hypothetical protein
MNGNWSLNFVQKVVVALGTAPFNMPPVRGKKVDRLTGLRWTLAPGVREADSR